jgi:hypothetical protein
MSASSDLVTQKSVAAVALPNVPEQEGLQENLDSLMSCFEKSLDYSSAALSGNAPEALSSRIIEPCDLAEISLREQLALNHFYPDLAETEEFQTLVEEYGVGPVSTVIREIGAFVSDKLSKSEKIAHGHEMIKDALEMGHVFKGIPVLVPDPSGPNGLALQWRDPSEKPQLTSIRDFGLYCEKGQEDHVAAASQKAPHFETEEKMQEAFQHLKSNIPTGLKNDGCDMRCYWASFLLENVLGCESVKIKVDHRDGLILQTSPPLVFEGVDWRMHTAPVVKLADGRQYVMDIALEKPIPLEEWLSCLHPDRDQLVLSYSRKWDVECKAGAEGTVVESLDRLQKDLRGLYLFEKVDGNQSRNPDGSWRRTSTWMSWVDELRVFAPVPQEKPIVTVITGFEKQSDGSFSPIIEQLPEESMFKQQDGLIFNGTNAHTKYQVYLRRKQLTLR